jgi:hypothetical protein
MKKIQLLIAMAIAVLTLASCSDKNEPVLVNQLLIRDQLAQLALPSSAQIQEKLASTNSALKKVASSQEIVSRRVLPLDKEYFEITETSATRFLQYYEIASNGEIKRLIQVAQTFPLKDGVRIDTLGWSAHADLEGIGIRKCLLWFSENITSMTVCFRGDDGLQLAYRANLWDGALYLPPLANGTWQVQVETFNKGIWQTFITMPTQIKKSDPDELLLIYNDITSFSDPQENTVAIATVSAEALQGNYLLVCEDVNGNYYSQPILSTITSDVSFAIPFNPKYIYIFGRNYQQTDIDPGIEAGPDGIYHYNL